MTEILTPGVIQAALGLATAIATGLFALYLKKYGDEKNARFEAEEQGDLLMGYGRRAFELIKAFAKADPKNAEKLAQAETLVTAMETSWNDAKVRTPEMEEYYGKLIVLLTELGAAQAV